MLQASSLVLHMHVSDDLMNVHLAYASGPIADKAFQALEAEGEDTVFKMLMHLSTFDVAHAYRGQIFERWALRCLRLGGTFKIVKLLPDGGSLIQELLLALLTRCFGSCVAWTDSSYCHAPYNGQHGHAGLLMCNYSQVMFIGLNHLTMPQS